ncbi:hypothetical protein Asp14428_20880 [Actinoplanes sp. NBRC 14428]|nr:hypothetical protein Asp14428_20880 [Actinoplanes sp. NBRC 14428]
MTGGNARNRRRLTRVGGGLLVLLWAAAAIPLTLDATEVARTRAIARVIGGPTDAVIVQLQEERRLSAGRLADVVDRSALIAQRDRTDEAVRQLRDALTGPMRRTAIGPEAAGGTDILLRQVDERLALRALVDGSSPDPRKVLNGYTGIVAAAFEEAPWLWPDRSTGTGSSLLALGRAREALSNEDAILVGAAGAATLDATDRTRVATLVLTRRVLLEEAAQQLPDASVPGYLALTADPAIVRLQGLEDDLLDPSAAAGKRIAPAWATSLDGSRTKLRAFETGAVREASREAVPGAVATVAGAGLVAGLGLVAVVAALTWLRRLFSGLGADADRTPATVRGESTEDAALLDLLLEQNRRNQGLLQRLMRLLDGVRGRTDDEDALGELTRVGHLAGRVRRNVEKTVTLSGGRPGRRWSAPVPVAGVVDEAAAEVPGSERVSIPDLEPAELVGAAVLDVTHLLAELIENAAAFSPAEAPVLVTGRYDEDHYVLAVTDHGPGMSEDDLRVAAEVLATTAAPQTRAWDGLYTAGRLAHRAGATVRLHNADDGGLTAQVLLPAALVASEGMSASDLGAGGDTAVVDLPATRRLVPRQRPRPGAAMSTMSSDE